MNVQPILTALLCMISFGAVMLRAQEDVLTKEQQDFQKKFQAASDGVAGAQGAIGFKFLFGSGTDVDHKQALHWFRKAAGQGDDLGQSGLGLMYKLGIGVERDPTEAAKWYLKAAEQGDADAQISLGNLYRDGEGVELDFDEALSWYRKAEAAGLEKAADAIASLYLPKNIEWTGIDAQALAKWLLPQAKEQTDVGARATIGLVLLRLQGEQFEFNCVAAIERLARDVRTGKLAIETKVYACYLFNRLGPSHAEKSKKVLLELLDDETAKLTFKQQVSVRENLWSAFWILGELNSAKKEKEELVVLHESKYGSDSRETLAARDAFAFFRSNIFYEHEAAIDLLIENIRICKTQNTGRRDLYNAFSSLGMLYKKLEEFEKAESYLLKAIAVFGDSSGSPKITIQNHVAFFNLAFTYGESGKSKQAKQAWGLALPFAEKFFGKDHNMTHSAMNGLATALAETGKTEEAKKLFERSHLSARKSGDSLSLGSLNYVKLLFEQGDFEGSEQVFQEGDPNELSERDFFVLRDREPEAIALQERIRQRELKISSKQLVALNSRQRDKFLKESFSPRFRKSLSVGFRYRDNNRAATLSAGWLLNGKSVAYEATGESALLSSKTLAPKVEQLKAVRGRLAVASIQGAKNASDQQRIADLESQERRLESELAGLGIAGNVDQRWKSTGTLMSKLPFDSRFVSIAKFGEFDFEGAFGSRLGLATKQHWGQERYVAWVVPPLGEGSVQCIDLGLADPIDKLVSSIRDALAKTPKQAATVDELKLEQEFLDSVEQLSSLIYQPLAPHVEEASELIISPDGELWSIPFEILRTNDQYLIESKRIRYLASGRELLRELKPWSAVSKPVVFANPEYDLNGDLVEGSTPHERFALRGGSTMRFPALAFSANEAAAIAPLIETYTGTKPSQFLSAAAQEATFKSLHRPKVLAISTHGYFEQDKSNTNPLLRCGLALAGANNRVEAVAAGKEDGILTGLEIVGTDLRGTELVVLSACETGLGEIANGEGVAGLRQAFQLAGAQSVVSSLWQVEDGETARLMKLFFQNLADGKSKSEALRQAQLSRIKARRARHGAAHPFFWAAFTLTGQD